MRVILADDQERVRFAMRVMLERQSGVTVVGEAQDAAELQTALEETQPDLVLLDWLLPGFSQVSSFVALRARWPEIMVVAVSSRPELAVEALQAGVVAFVSKVEGPEQLLEAVDACRERLRSKEDNGQEPI